MGGYMLEGYLSGLEENEVRFISENDENFRIIVDEEHFFRLQHERIEKDIVEGYLFNNRNFKMFGCIYNGRSLSCKGYVYSSSNNPPDTLSQFDRIMFTGKPIDVFAGGSVGTDRKERHTFSIMDVYDTKDDIKLIHNKFVYSGEHLEPIVKKQIPPQKIVGRIVDRKSVV